MTHLLFLLPLLLALSPAAAQVAPSYVGSAECAGCHADQADQWRGSHHGLAWTLPSDRSVVADFDGTSFTGGGVWVAFSRDETGYHATVTEGDGATTVRHLHSVVGIAPLQQYLFETEPGRLQSFDVVWDDVRKTWYHLYPEQDLRPDDGMHWTGSYKNWNGRCAECHATGFQKNYDQTQWRYRSTQAEVGVGCEACHGPGSAHLDWAETRKPITQAGLDTLGFTMPADASGGQWIQQCAGCHSRREAFNDGNRLPGTAYADAYRLSLLTPRLYFPDVQIRDEVYVYGLFLQSKMYDKGVTRLNCHDPHAADVIAPGNAVCTQCHSPAGNPDFPTLPLKEFDSAAHHFHAEGPAGAQCGNCHMTTQTYMGIGARADHSFRIPRPDLNAVTGAPDACTTCHDDRTPDWAAAQIEAWYPGSADRGTHFGTSFARAAHDPVGAVPELLALARDQATPTIVRATALYLMQFGADDRTVAATASLLEDENPLVRLSAVLLQRAAPSARSTPRLTELLADPTRLVRIDAAQALLGAKDLPKTAAIRLEAAINDWRESLSHRSDLPETHLVLGGISLVTRDFAGAESAFREAATLDPQMVDAWIMLARIGGALHGAEAALSAVRLGLAANPDDPTLLALRRQLSGQ